MPANASTIVFSPISGLSGFTYGTLNAGTTYYLVTTGFGNSACGAFTNTITPCEGSIIAGEAAAVPEPPGSPCSASAS